jgi:hypothetical protein
LSRIAVLIFECFILFYFVLLYMFFAYVLLVMIAWFDVLMCCIFDIDTFDNRN